MIFDLRISFNSSHNQEITAKDLDEAEKIAEKITEDFIGKQDLSGIKPSVSASSKNFVLQKGGIYLIRKYKRYVPAECIRSYHSWRYFEHLFQYLDTRKYLRLKGETPVRLGGKLCDDGVIKPKCNSCVAKFNCFTRKK